MSIIDLLKRFPVVPLGADKILCPNYSNTSERKILHGTLWFSMLKVEFTMELEKKLRLVK